MKKQSIPVAGMTCAHCESRVEKALLSCAGVHSAKASFSKNLAVVEYDETRIDESALHRAITEEGYAIGGKSQAADVSQTSKGAWTARKFIGVIVILLAAYLIVDNTVGFNFIPEVTESMGYGMLFFVGILTSLHCVAMCGGITMSQCVSGAAAGTGKWKPAILYNLGRVISYTLIGGIAGAIGKAVSFTGWAKGLVAILAGLFMVIMGLSMTGIFPWLNRLVPRMPRFLHAKAGEAKRGKGPLIVGLLNGLMPCGPLQSMQLYALGTGSFLAGALSMLAFSLGTVPLMFGLGALSTLLGGKFTAKMMKVGAILVVVLGVVMAGRGFALSGVAILPQTGGAETAQQQQDAQIINTHLTGDGYPDISVKKGIPVRWNLSAKAEDLNGCNDEIVIPALSIERKLQPGDNIIEFTPTETGTIPYSCWMGMITANIVVTE